jgi:CYTH domain-containing protein
MATETERKWRLLDAPDADRLALTAGAPTRIEQHYLDAPPGSELRVRHRSGPTGDRFVVTVKSEPVAGASGALVRNEDEHDIDRAEFAAMIARPGHRGVVVKQRWLVPHDGRTFELDHLERPDAGWLVELELGADEPTDLAIEPPEWLGPVADVTHDPAWRNAALAVPLVSTPSPPFAST